MNKLRRIVNFCVIIFAVLLISNVEGTAQGKGKGKMHNNQCKMVLDSNAKKCPNNCNPKSNPNDTVKAHCGHFVDKDGDGINDNRCSGMGIGKRKRHGKVLNVDSVEVINKKK